MTIYRGPVINWRTDPRTADKWDEPPYEQPSPNLVQIEAYLRTEFGGGNMGIHGDRSTRTSANQSEHSWGAALDWGFGPAQHDYLTGYGHPFGDTLTVAASNDVLDWVVEHSEELHIQAIVAVGRSWKANRTHNGRNGWIDYNSGYTGHAHLVTTYEGWGDSTPVAQRLNETPPSPPIQPTRIQIEDESMMNYEINADAHYDSRNDPAGPLQPGEVREVEMGRFANVYEGTLTVIRTDGSEGYVTVAGSKLGAVQQKTSITNFDADGKTDGWYAVGAPDNKLYVACHGGKCDIIISIAKWGGGNLV